MRAAYERQIQTLLDRLLAEQRWPDLRQWAEHWIAQGAAPEPAFRALMLAYAAQGDMSGLAGVYQRCMEALRDQLGLDPSPQTRTLYEQLLRGEGLPVAAAQPAPPPIVETTDKVVPNNLPASTTGFIGREAQLAEIDRLLADPTCRLITLAGVGGIGKSRLALQAARQQLNHFADGVFFVPLASVNSETLIVSAIAQALGFSFYGGGDPAEQLFSHLRDRQMLLVLDNFEHLVAGGGVVNTLLERAPRVKCLTTSRERLNLRGEWVISLEGLGVPDRDDVLTPEDYSAIQLFLQSARRAQAGFALGSDDIAQVIRICRLVEGLPLAIELASAWVRAISPKEIADEIARNLDFLSTRLQDLPTRHRSLRAVFDHSWNLLTTEERQAFARLSVFRGGFSREAAVAVADASLLELSGLMDKSLVRRMASGRYWVHELLRQYAQDKLNESGDEAHIRNGHLAYYLKLAQTTDPQLRATDQLAWLSQLDLEHDNLRVALHWASSDEQVTPGLQLSGALARFWYLRGHWVEGRQWLNTFLEMAKDAEADAPLKAALINALAGAGWLANESGADLVYYERALTLSREIGDRWHEAYALRGLGGSNARWADPEQAKAMLDQSLAIFTALKDQWGVALVRFNLGWVEMLLESPEAKVRDWEQSLGEFRRIGDRWGMAVTLSALSYAARFMGDYKYASSLSKESLQLFTELGDRAGVSESLSRLASVAYRRSDYGVAAEIYEESLVIAQALDDRWDVAQIKAVLGMIAAYQGRFETGMAVIDAAIQLGEEVLGHDALGFMLNNRALILYLQGDLTTAERMWTQTAELERNDNNSVGVGYALGYLGQVALLQGEVARAEGLLHEAHDQLVMGGEKRGLALGYFGLGRLALAKGSYAEARQFFGRSLQLRQELGDKQGLAEGLEGLAQTLAANTPDPAQAQKAVGLLSAADCLRAKIGAPLPLVEREGYDAALQALRGCLPEADFRAAWDAGNERKLEEWLEQLLKD
jgi:predicted ATPase